MGGPVDSRVRSCFVSFVRRGPNHKICKMSVDTDAILKICDIYDWDGKGVLDMYYFMDIFYALGMNITKKVCVKYGQTEDVDKKFVKFDEVVKLIQEAVKEPENSGTYADYAELCKLYDKNDNGTMMLAELDNILSNMGDMVNKEDTMKLLDLLAGEEDEDGFIPYKPFLDKLCGKAPINPPTA